MFGYFVILLNITRNIPFRTIVFLWPSKQSPRTHILFLSYQHFTVPPSSFHQQEKRALPGNICNFLLTCPPLYRRLLPWITQTYPLLYRRFIPWITQTCPLLYRRLLPSTTQRVDRPRLFKISVSECHASSIKFKSLWMWLSLYM